MSHYYDVEEFHQKFDVKAEKAIPHFPEADVIKYRENFLQEELDEFVKSNAEGNMADSMDALIDLIYVALGTAQLYGVEGGCWHEMWDEVQKANMAKERAKSKDDTRGKRGHELDVVKPEGWTPPNHNPILKKYGHGV